MFSQPESITRSVSGDLGPTVPKEDVEEGTEAVEEATP
jgi:hypothetical protein